MKQLYPDLWQTAPEHPVPAYPRLTTHAYLLVRRGGNVLLYSSGLSAEHPRIRKLGGLTHQYLSHRDEVGPALARIKEAFRSRLCCHRLEEPAAREFCPVDLTFDRREVHLDDVEVIPTPGHTSGSTCFLVRSPGARADLREGLRPNEGRTYLFTGDTVFLSNGAWDTLVLQDKGGSTSDLKESVKLLRDLDPDVVISSASVGSISVKEMQPGAWRSAMDEVLRSLSQAA
jgi:glyoxylase-like metal-dependent hydrolase (beta-lactamase superfamily II)